MFQNEINSISPCIYHPYKLLCSWRINLRLQQTHCKRETTSGEKLWRYRPIESRQHHISVEVQQVKDYCNKHQQVVIYDYTPYCGSSACMQVNDFVDMCKANGTNPLVIGDSFWGLADTRKLGIPLLMIDPQPLGTKWRSRYVRLFFNELIDSNSPNPPEGLYFSFQNGKYIGNFRSCKEALEALNIKDVKTL